MIINEQFYNQYNYLKRRANNAILQIKLFTDEILTKVNFFHKYPTILKNSLCPCCSKQFETTAHFLINGFFIITVQKKLITRIKNIILLKNLKISKTFLIKQLRRHIFKIFPLQVDQFQF